MSKTLLTLAAGAALAGVLWITGCSERVGPPSQAENKPAASGKPAPFDLNAAVGKSAPAFNLKDGDGKTVHFADYKGKVVLLDFWATWCGPCKIEIPWFIDFERQFKDRGFSVVGVSMDEDGWKAIKPYAANMKMNYPILLGDDNVSTAYGGLDSLPTTLLIDRQGKVASVHVGVSMGKDEFKNAIEKLLAEPGASASLDSHRALALLAGPNAR